MDEIYIIIQKIGSLETIVDKAYWYYSDAYDNAQKLNNDSQIKGYTDFQYKVKSLELVGSK